MMGRLSELAEAQEEARYQAERQRRLSALRARDSTPPPPPSLPGLTSTPSASSPPERISVPVDAESSHSRVADRRNPNYRVRSLSPKNRNRSPDRRVSFPRSARRLRPSVDRLRRRSWSRGRSVSSSRSRSRSPRCRSEYRDTSRRGFGLSTYRTEFDDRRMRRRSVALQPDRAHLTNLLRETMIANRRLDIEQRDMAIHHLRNIAPEDLGRPITLMSEWLNSSNGALKQADKSNDFDDEAEVAALQPGLDMFGREPPRQETYQQFKARKLKELAQR